MLTFSTSIYIELPDIEIVIYDYLEINCMHFEKDLVLSQKAEISTLNYWTVVCAGLKNLLVE